MKMRKVAALARSIVFAVATMIAPLKCSPPIVAKIMNLSNRYYLMLILLVSMTPVFSTGCMLISPDGKNLDEVVGKPTGNSFTVMLKGMKPETMEITEGMRVQDVLNSSGAIKRYGKMDIVVSRMLVDKGRRFRMEVDYDPAKKRIPFEQDYVIHANDIVMIQPDNTTQFDKVVDSLSGVLGRSR